MTEAASRARVDRLFRAALLIKGVDGAAEFGAAVILALLPALTLQRLVADVLVRDMLGSSHGLIARHLETVSDAFANGSRTFAVVYLGLHGLLKLGLVVALLRRWLPAYPVAAVVLGAFVAYELYRAVTHGSLVLPLLAALDALILVLVVREYRMLRRGSPIAGENPHENDHAAE
ncbi:MAG: DUF2127 domain-containing protein [Pseudonocardia sp.]